MPQFRSKAEIIESVRNVRSDQGGGNTWQMALVEIAADIRDELRVIARELEYKR